MMAYGPGFSGSPYSLARVCPGAPSNLRSFGRTKVMAAGFGVAGPLELLARAARRPLIRVTPAFAQGSSWAPVGAPEIASAPSVLPATMMGNAPAYGVPIVG